MTRCKQPHPMTDVVQTYVNEHTPELAAASIHIRLLDGPPDAPRYAANAETCPAGPCPYGVPLTLVQAGQCPVLDCPLRCSLRLLIDRDGTIVSAHRSGVHWS